METSDGPILYPFVLRMIEGIWDITSLYGPGGIPGNLEIHTHLSEFYAELRQWLGACGVVCSFERYHPVLQNNLLREEAADMRIVGNFVVVPLHGGASAITARARPSVRKDWAKADRNGITVTSEASLDGVTEFLRVYNATMDRHAAARSYRYGPEFFTEMHRCLGGHEHIGYRFFYAAIDGITVSCELVLHSECYAYSFLGGTDAAFLASGANPAIKRAVLHWYSAAGATHYLLGGGPAGDDGVFRYKQAYAPDGIVPSRIGCTIYDQAAYDALRTRMTVDGRPMRPERFQFYDCG